MKKIISVLFFCVITVAIYSQTAEEYYTQAKETDYTEKGNAKKAISFLNKAIESNPNYKEALVLRAKIYEWQGSYDNEIKDISTLIKSDSLKPEYYKLRAIAYALKTEAEKAIDDYTKAYNLDTSMIDCIYERGMIYYNSYKGKKDQLALADFNFCINYASLNYKSLAYIGRGKLFENQGDLVNAINEYNTAIKINPLCKEAYLARGILKISQNQEGCYDLLKYRDLNGPNAQEYLNNYCYK
ncbi:MAG TPA: hypothetical protein PKK00_02135 [Bacteroidales bacterium]|nr:hypothetical protein [Bacteroidales bacterium]HPS15773.1 hypothetical protein [Bacteroidales bacterium]